MTGRADAGPVFVVGSSRSGTTMMARILGRHPSVLTFNELHFFEQVWSGDRLGEDLDAGEAVDIFSRLLAIQRNGYLSPGDPTRFRGEAAGALGTEAGSDAARFRPGEVFGRFLAHESEREGRTVACDHTPRNVFYLQEIHRTFPGARVVNMVRDPRGVMLSQKNKWKRRFLGGGSIPLREACRAWINYHPITIAQLWKGSVRAVDERPDGEPLLTVHFEDLLREPEVTVRRVCRFLGFEFRREMLMIPRVGSSNRPDRPEETGIDPDRASRWREGGLSDTEVWLCQRIAADRLDAHGYRREDVRPNPLRLLLELLAFPLKTGAALLANLGRAKSLWSAVRRRLA